MGLRFLLVLVLFCSCSVYKTENKEDVLFEIKRGESFSSVVKRLVEEKIISHPRVFKFQAKLSGSSKNLKFGIYLIKKNESYSSIINKFYSGKSYSINVTIPEGYNIFDIADLLESKNLVKKEDFLKTLRDKDLLDYAGLNKGQSLEGYLFPDSYSIPLNYSPKQIAKMMITRFKEVVNDEILNVIKSKNITLNKVLTMASIIQKEARFEHEMPIISGVYYNRIEKRYKLQADPTLIYALILDGKYDGNIRKSHFDYHSKYNTYRYYGLPPGPICNSGKMAILAAIYPAKVDYLYFVAKPDGTHYFSKTLEEHNKAVHLYQIIPAIERRKQRLNSK
ncbi:MAG: endolytic transglycosylase MltG [Brevinematales bacterium]|nr:endolytic transglycosylase MltG [Brevinematales bacterium]